jgi:hypothetical protein
MLNATFSIFLGDTKTMYLKAVNSSCLGVGDPLDLTSCTEIVINLPNADGTISQLKLTEDQVVIASPAVLGKFSAEIDGDLSALLNVGEFQNVDVTFTIGSEVFTVAFVQALSVYEVA